MKGAQTIVRDAVIVAAVSAVVGLTFNALRTEGLPLVADKDYRDLLFVPCPVVGADVEV